MSATFKVSFDEIRPEMRVRNSPRDFKIFDVCTHTWTDLRPCLNSYSDPLVTKFALIYGSSYDQVCTHNWTIPINMHSKLFPSPNDRTVWI